jgi:hypothetical protein
MRSSLRSLKTLLLASSSVIVLALAALACGNAAPGATPPGVSNAPVSAPDSPSAPSVSASLEGADCSDDAAVQKKCAPGLVCSSNPMASASEHPARICRKP